MGALLFIGLLFVMWVLFLCLAALVAVIWERVSYEIRVRRVYRTYRRGL